MARPFGDPDTARAAAARCPARQSPLIRGTEPRGLSTPDKARRLLLKLCAIACETIPDYDSARQIAWAFQVIYRESVPGRDPLIDQALADLERDLRPESAAGQSPDADCAGASGSAEADHELRPGSVSGVISRGSWSGSGDCQQFEEARR